MASPSCNICFSRLHSTFNHICPICQVCGHDRDHPHYHEARQLALARMLPQFKDPLEKAQPEDLLKAAIRAQAYCLLEEILEKAQPEDLLEEKQ